MGNNSNFSIYLNPCVDSWIYFQSTSLLDEDTFEVENKSLSDSVFVPHLQCDIEGSLNNLPDEEFI